VAPRLEAQDKTDTFVQWIRHLPSDVIHASYSNQVPP